MFKFDTITIDRLSKEDMLMILQALDYTYENKKIDEFLKLKNTLMDDLCTLAEVNSQEELLNILAS